MKVDIRTGTLDQARQCLSPNFDERPDGETASLIVIHGISLPPGEFGGPYIDQLFTNTLVAGDHPFFKEIHQLKVSSHLLIRRDGEIVQYVPFHKRAWHAGVSRYNGREACNNFSIGIELEGQDQTPYADSQYQVLARVITALLEAYPDLDKNDIVGHSEIAPGRKTDPGPAFEWTRLGLLLGE